MHSTNTPTPAQHCQNTTAMTSHNSTHPMDNMALQSKEDLNSSSTRHKPNIICSSTNPTNKKNPCQEPVSRVLLLLDITNMFNEISRDACRLLLLATPELKDMVPHFDQTCKEPNRCWHKTDKGACRHFQQPESFAQGCPLSGSCAAIALSLLLKKISTKNSLLDKTKTPTSPHIGTPEGPINIFHVSHTYS
jgi:hypothetical protein